MTRAAVAEQRFRYRESSGLRYVEENASSLIVDADVIPGLIILRKLAQDPDLSTSDRMSDAGGLDIRNDPLGNPTPHDSRRCCPADTGVTPAATSMNCPESSRKLVLLTPVPAFTCW